MQEQVDDIFNDIFSDITKYTKNLNLLYVEDNKKCHDIEELNCYFCACPNFRVDSKKSFCNIDSKYGGTIKTQDFTHQDCSKCSVPHSKEYIKRYFDRDWKIIMKNIFISK